MYRELLVIMLADNVICPLSNTLEVSRKWKFRKIKQQCIPVISIASFICFYVLFKSYGDIEEGIDSSPVLSLASTIGLLVLLLGAIFSLIIWWGKISLLAIKGKKDQISRLGLVIGSVYTILIVIIYTNAYL